MACTGRKFSEIVNVVRFMTGAELLLCPYSLRVTYHVLLCWTMVWPQIARLFPYFEGFVIVPMSADKLFPRKTKRTPLRQILSLANRGFTSLLSAVGVKLNVFLYDLEPFSHLPRVPLRVAASNPCWVNTSKVELPAYNKRPNSFQKYLLDFFSYHFSYII